MSLRKPLLGFACVAALATLPSASTAAAPFNVTSTLDGKTVLPHRMYWIGKVTLPAAQIKEVDFLVDGKVDWVEHKAPYVYSSDDNGKNLGFLVTSWLSPGRHRFAVRAVATDGRSATDTVVARVLPPPEVPAALAGTWRRTITDTSGAPKAGSKGNPTDTLTPPGTYEMTFDPRWINDVFPCTDSPCTFVAKTGAGGEFDDDWIPGAKTFSVMSSVTFRIPKDSYRLAGWWCRQSGPGAEYDWSVSGNTLTLAPVGGKDACSIRGYIWTGTWTRVG